jgi:hypothetical protein
VILINKGGSTTTYNSINDLLVAKYGQPLKENSEKTRFGTFEKTAMWMKDETKILLTYEDIPGITFGVYVEYSPKDGGKKSGSDNL